MRIRIASHAAYFVLPALQFMPTWGWVMGHWVPWQFVIWWGNRGLQIEGSTPGEQDGAAE